MSFLCLLNLSPVSSRAQSLSESSIPRPLLFLKTAPLSQLLFPALFRLPAFPPPSSVSEYELLGCCSSLSLLNFIYCKLYLKRAEVQFSQQRDDGQMSGLPLAWIWYVCRIWDMRESEAACMRVCVGISQTHLMRVC